MELYEYECTIDYATATGRAKPKYDILETVDDTTTGTIWHKLLTNAKATELIPESKASSQWEIREENTGKKFLWVTDQFLTVLHIQGLQKGL